MEKGTSEPKSRIEEGTENEDRALLRVASAPRVVTYTYDRNPPCRCRDAKSGGDHYLGRTIWYRIVDGKLARIE